MTSQQPTPPADQHPDLLGLVRGELTNAEVVSTADHLESCDSCLSDLVETTVGHALLARAGRTLLDEESHPAAEPERPLPPAPVPTSLPRRWARPLVAVAAAAALVAGTAGVTWQLVRPEQLTSPPVATTQTADFAPVEGAGGGRVQMVDDAGAVSMTVETRDLPRIKKGEFYQVWLFNPETGKMLSLGILGPGGKGGFEIPDGLLGGYQVVDVSLEEDDGDPGHSITSVLRADYSDPASASS